MIALTLKEVKKLLIDDGCNLTPGSVTDILGTLNRIEFEVRQQVAKEIGELTVEEITDAMTIKDAVIKGGG